MAKKPSTSFELTEITAPVLEKLKLAKWDIKEVVNAGILMFSKATDEEQKLFVFAATKALNLEENAAARDLSRDWISEIVADAQAYREKKKQHPETKSSKSG